VGDIKSLHKRQSCQQLIIAGNWNITLLTGKKDELRVEPNRDAVETDTPRPDSLLQTSDGIGLNESHTNSSTLIA